MAEALKYGYGGHTDSTGQATFRITRSVVEPKSMVSTR